MHELHLIEQKMNLNGHCENLITGNISKTTIQPHRSFYHFSIMIYSFSMFELKGACYNPQPHPTNFLNT